MPVRRWMVAAVVPVVWAAGCAGATPTTLPRLVPSPSYDGTLAAKVVGYPGAVSVSTRLTPTRPLDIASGRLVLDGQAERVILVAHDGHDQDGPEDYGPLTVAAGVRLDLVSGGLPGCGSGRRAPLVLELRLVGGGSRRYLLDDHGRYATAAARVCRGGVRARILSSRQDVDGTFAVTLTLVNPKSHPVTVTSAAYDAGTTHWSASSAVVAARGTGHLVVRGRGTAHLAGCSHDTPWGAGRLTADGRRVSLPGSADTC